ncbi:MAG: beta-ketoacyl synthase N-terminal-like domain-containing protein, partial [Chloroflexota bacterium]|nr:beta-ketoacyl synthase N-terminal-like domain-containing protein [Chloroflexota bacterium]
MTVDRTRVVVTGMGVMAPTGQKVEEYWDNLVSGVSGIGKITLCDASEFPNDIAGEVTGFDASQYANAKETRRMARFSQMAVAAAATAIENSGLNLSEEDGERLGVVMGNGNG